MSVGGAVFAHSVFRDFIFGSRAKSLRLGFPNDAPEVLWKWSREAEHYKNVGNLIKCYICPHMCMLGEGDRSFCRVKVVKHSKLFTLAYGNPCAVHVDPIEKKPLYHYLPGVPIFSIATAGCNLRCVNCQNWSISQVKPEQTRNYDLMPERIVKICQDRNIPTIAYTYSEPIIFYEYVKDTAMLAKEKDIKNVIVTAGFINEKPLRSWLKFIDAVTLDVKAFSEHFYKKITSARLSPILRTIEVIKEEGVHLELSNLVIPTLSDDIDDIYKFSKWIVKNIGENQVLHFLRFHPQYKLWYLPPTPVSTLESSYKAAKDAGLKYVYIGNVPGHPAQHTYCANCGRLIIRRTGFFLRTLEVEDGRCKFCSTIIPGVWS